MKYRSVNTPVKLKPRSRNRTLPAFLESLHSLSQSLLSLSFPKVAFILMLEFSFICCQSCFNSQSHCEDKMLILFKNKILVYIK